MKDDNNCRYLVRVLQAQKGREFRDAAKRYAALKKGRVYFVAQSQLKDQLGEPLQGDAPIGKDGDVWIVGEQSKGDFLVTAVHESKHLEGHGHDEALILSVYRAWIELSPADHAQAVNSGRWVYLYTKGQAGIPPFNP